MRVSVDGGRLFVDFDGPGLVPEGPSMRERPTIILLHPGPGFDHSVWKVYLGPALATIAQVVYVDLRGHGRSDPIADEDLRLDVWADDLPALCSALEIERPVVLGHGFGALVATRYASRHPDHSRGLVLSAPYARLVAPRVVEAFDRLGDPEAGEVARRFYEQPDHLTLGEYLRRCYPLVVRYEEGAETLSRTNWNPEAFVRWTATEGTSFDLRPDLAAVRVPTLVLAGEDDPYAPLGSVREAADALPPELVRFRSYPGVRHSVYRETDPKAVDEVRAFLLGLERADAEPDE
jgi:pimeloyl-ACP methyl ester carboxylesterase